MNQCMNKAFI